MKKTLGLVAVAAVLGACEPTRPPSGLEESRATHRDSGRSNITVESAQLPSIQTTVLAASGGSCATPPENMVSWWPGDGSAEDFVGDNHGSLSGGATYGTGLVTSGGGQAFSFDGIDAIVQVPHSADLNPSPSTGFTIDAWANLASTVPNNGTVVGKGDPWQEAYVIDHLGSEWRGFIRNSEGQAVVITAGLQIGVWTHLALTWDGAALRFYVNGGLAGSASVTSILSSTSFLGIGHRSEAGFNDDDLDLEFNGLIEEVEYFGRVLSGSEIADIYNAGSAGKCKACDSIFDTSTGDPVLDDPVFQEGLVDAMIKSEAFQQDIEQRLEHPGYVYQRPDGSIYTKLTVDPLVQTGCESTPGAPSKNSPDDDVIAVFHTHPFSHGDVLPNNCGSSVPIKYDAKRYGGGSSDDWEFATEHNRLSYIIDLDKVYRLDPGVPKSDWRSNPNKWAWNPSLCGL